MFPQFYRKSNIFSCNGKKEKYHKSLKCKQSFTIFFVKLEFWILCKKSRQNERSSVLCSLNVNKVSRLFRKSKFAIFCFLWKKSRQIERRSALLSLNVNKVSRIFSCFFFNLKLAFFVIIKTPSSVQNCHELN